MGYFLEDMKYFAIYNPIDRFCNRQWYGYKGNQYSSDQTYIQVVHWGRQKSKMEDDYFFCDYTDKQEPIETEVYDMIQYIRFVLGCFFFILVHQTQEFQGSYYTLPYAGQTILGFALGIILLPSPWLTEATKGNSTVKSIEFSPLLMNTIPLVTSLLDSRLVWLGKTGFALSAAN